MMNAVDRRQSLLCILDPVPAEWQNHVIQDHGIYPTIYSEVERSEFWDSVR